MSLKSEMAAKWRAEVEALDERARHWETGKLRAYMDGVDVTEEQAPMLRRHADALREAVALIESE